MKIKVIPWVKFIHICIHTLFWQLFRFESILNEYFYRRLFCQKITVSHEYDVIFCTREKCHLIANRYLENFNFQMKMCGGMCECVEWLIDMKRKWWQRTFEFAFLFSPFNSFNLKSNQSYFNEKKRETNQKNKQKTKNERKWYS